MEWKTIAHGYRQLELAKLLRRDYRCAQNKGEFLMKRRLDMRVRCDDFADNPRPGNMTNPLTKQPLELDRLYWKLRVAFEVQRGRSTKA